ncbi:unnamed protein product [Toxocara canis]|nr:unnamed protein product [Toxocara canis]
MYRFHIRVLFALVVLYRTALSTCVDDMDNVITVEDIGGENAVIKVRDIQLLTYDLEKKPHCNRGAPSVKFPGYLKARSGKLEISRPLKEEDGRLIVELSLEQDSFFVGQVCKKGVSTNSYVSDDTCSFDLCERMGENYCDLLRKSGDITLKDLPESFKDFIFLDNPSTELIAGDWKVSVYLKQRGKVVGAIRVGKRGQWTNVATAQSRDEL